MVTKYNILCETLHIETREGREVSIFHLVPRQSFAIDYGDGRVDYFGGTERLIGTRSGLGGSVVVLRLRVRTDCILELYTDTPAPPREDMPTSTPEEIVDLARRNMARQCRSGV